MTFRFRLITTYLLLFVAIISVQSIYVYKAETDRDERRVVLNLTDSTSQYLDSIDDLFDRLLAAMVSLDKVRAWTDGSPVDYVNERLKQYCAAFGGFDRMTVYDDAGTIVADSENREVGRSDPNAMWREGIAGRFGYRIDTGERGSNALYIYRRVTSRDGRLVRVIIGRVPFEVFGKMSHGFGSYESREKVHFDVTLVSAGGVLLHVSEKVKWGGATEWEELRKVADKLWLEGKRHELISSRSNIRIIAMPDRKSGRMDYPWVLSVDAAKDKLFATSIKELREMALFALFLGVCSSLVIWMLARNLSRPVEELARHAAILGKGDFSSFQDLDQRGDEFGLLVDSFKQMGEMLEVLIGQLSESEEKFRTVAEFTADWEYWIGPDMYFVFISPSCEAVTGYSAEEFTRDPGLMFRIVHPQDAGVYGEHFSKIDSRDLDSDRSALEFRIIRRDGAVRWISHVCRNIVANDGKYLGRRGSNRDVTERKAAEEEIRRLNSELEHLVSVRTLELERINKDLAGFCYAISHELRAPVARLQGFSRVLREDCAEEDRYFCYERIETASRQLQTVIDAILMLSRLSRMELNFTTVDLTAGALEIVAVLQEGELWNAHEVIIQEGMHCRGDVDLLHICLENLLANAVKYSSKVLKPKVTFGMESTEEGKVFFVRDNGAGFDMAFADKLFVPFQRLHQQDEFPGTGIGLATVQRILERHGGRIWAEGKEGEGATFFFTLGDQG